MDVKQVANLIIYLKCGIFYKLSLKVVWYMFEINEYGANRDSIGDSIKHLSQPVFIRRMKEQGTMKRVGL